MMTKTEAKNLSGDYIPSGDKVDVSKLQFRRTKEFEVYRCGVQSDYDPQSGPIYCGALAEWMCRVPGGVVCSCERHSYPLNKVEQDETERVT